MKSIKIVPLVLCLCFTNCCKANGQSLDKDQIQAYLNELVEGRTLADNSLLLGINGDSTHFHQLKGEWLFLDYWSTSCKPCIKEMPYLKALQARYNDQRLRVVMINLDKKEKKWKRGIKLFNPPGRNYTTNRSIENPFFALNLVELTADDGTKVLSTLMPQYVLISPEGMIVDKKMPKPSDPLFQKVLDQYLNSSSQKSRNQ